MTRILLVDDDGPFRQMMHEMLERAGHEVRDAANGKIAMDLDREQPGDLILMDLVMPEKEGLETIGDLLRSRPEAKIIAMSGGNRVDCDVFLDVALRLGAKRALGKPFSRAELLSAIDQVMAGSAGA